MLKSLTNVSMKASSLRRLLNWYPPYLGAGIRCDAIADDFSSAKVSMPLTIYNRNYVGVQFGGSLYAMCDPWFMLLLINSLGREFIVWDKAGSIEYRKPGKGTVTAQFDLPASLMDELRSLAPDEKKLIDLSVNVLDESGDVVAKVKKTEYVRRKPLQSRL